LTDSKVVGDEYVGCGMILESPLRRDCLSRSIITGSGSCGGGDLGGDSSLFEVEKRFRDGAARLDRILAPNLFRINKATREKDISAVASFV
jgi:hypothetical protein